MKRAFLITAIIAIIYLFMGMILVAVTGADVIRKKNPCQYTSVRVCRTPPGLCTQELELICKKNDQ